MKTRQDLARALKIKVRTQLVVLDFFLFLAERLKENIVDGFRIYIAHWNLDQIMFPGVLTGGEGQYQYFRWSKSGEVEYIDKTQLFDFVGRIQQQLNPEAAETKELYRFEPDDWHLIILADLVHHILIAGEANFSQNYISQEPQANCIVAELDGQFYRRARPEDPPLVDAGDEVEICQDVGVIVVNKTNNYMTAPLRCRITKVLVKNDTAVKAGQPLFEIIPIFGEQE